MAASIANALNHEGGVTFHVESATDTATPFDELQLYPEVLAPTIDHFPEAAVVVKSEIPTSGNDVPTTVNQSAWHKASSARGSRILEAPAISALLVLRTSLTSALENERGRLAMARYEVGKPANIIRIRLTEERDRLKCIDQKLVDESDAHGRAANQYQRAQDMVGASEIDNTVEATKSTNLFGKSITKTCEEFFPARVENVAIKYTQQESLELKQERARERVATLLSELNAAEELQKKKQTTIDNSLKNLKALASWMETL